MEIRLHHQHHEHNSKKNMQTTTPSGIREQINRFYNILTFSKGISGVQSVVFSSSTVLCWIPLSLLSLEGGGGGEAGVEGLLGELVLLVCSSSGHNLLENMLEIVIIFYVH